MSKDEDRIRQRAYEIWEREGRPHGEELKHWLSAFEELGSGAAGGKGVKAAAAKPGKPAAKASKPALAKTKPAAASSPPKAPAEKKPKPVPKAKA